MKTQIYVLAYTLMILSGCASKGLQWTDTAGRTDRSKAEKVFERDKYQCESAHTVAYVQGRTVQTQATQLFYDCMKQKGWVLKKVATGGTDFIFFEVKDGQIQ